MKIGDYPPFSQFYKKIFLVVCVLVSLIGCRKKSSDIASNNDKYQNVPLAIIDEIKQEDDFEKKVSRAIRTKYEWQTKGELLIIQFYSGEEKIYYIEDDRYYPNDIQTVNKILKDLRFHPDDFNDKFKLATLINVIRGLYGKKTSHFFGSVSSYTRRDLVNTWLKGREEQYQEFLELTKYGANKIDNGNWKINFQTFNSDGSVDAWELVCSIDSSNKLTINDIKVNQIKAINSYAYCIDG